MPSPVHSPLSRMQPSHGHDPDHVHSEPCLRTLIVDNYDSYTFNLLQLFDEHQLTNVVIIRNDQFEWSHFEQEILPFFDQVILSPGPGRPERPEDFGICSKILQKGTIPVFGVCLGHQGIGIAHGAKVTYGPEPVHGQIAHIEHNGSGLFDGLPQSFEAVRYHSLVIQDDDQLGDLLPSAWCHSFPLIKPHVSEHTPAVEPTGSRSIMGIRHRTLPHHGVQFHPESISTQYGRIMMNNFFNISLQYYRDQGRTDHFGTLPQHIRMHSVVPTTFSPAAPLTERNPKALDQPYSLIIQALDSAIFPEPETVFSSLFLTGPRTKAASWWLDSARQPHPMSRFSFMGGMETKRYHGSHTQDHIPTSIPGAAQAVIQYSTLHKEIHVQSFVSPLNQPTHSRIQLDNSSKDLASRNFWDWTSKLMSNFAEDYIETTVFGSDGNQKDFGTVPFDFFAGMVGYLGYEMKRESLEGYHTPAEQECHCAGHSGKEALQQNACTCNCLRKPDASFVLATQAVVFDHVDKQVYVLGLVNNFPGHQFPDIQAPIGFNSRDDCQTWIDSVSESISALFRHSPSSRRSSLTTHNIRLEGDHHSTPYLVKQRHRRQSSAGLVSPFKFDVTEKDYLKAIRDSLDYIHEGESYELCLTTQLRAKIPLHHADPSQTQQQDAAYELYTILRKLNPAPFSAFLSLPTAGRNQVLEDANDIVPKLILLSSSPERFLKVGQKPSDEEVEPGQEKMSSRTVEMKPIKGTAAVAKGCFCREDEGCGLDERDDDSSEHAHDDGQGSDGSLATPGRVTAENGRYSRADLCAVARQRENQSRIDSLSKNVKERAENLMIVDLIRNDLAHVCSSKSVRVPYLMHVESYETVHQLVTTVRGELFDHVDNAQAVRACFPPGSMTGAPKLRSVQLLDSLEHHVERGVYSGCLGYIGVPAAATAAPLNPNAEPAAQPHVRSAVDMSVVIRTAVLSVDPPKEKGSLTTLADISVGAGGALTILSDAQEEWREVLLKSRSVVPSVMAYLRQTAP